jgi:hypothetical protein
MQGRSPQRNLRGKLMIEGQGRETRVALLSKKLFIQLL